MPCLPESGGCERPFTDAFVAHLNRVEHRRYTHRACLDAMDSTVPQPEALYVEGGSELQLVIERKSISWPVDYAYRHSNDHVVGEVFSRELEDLTIDDLYEIRLPMLMKGKRADLTGLAKHAAGQIRAHWSAIAAGSDLQGDAGKNWWWHFRLAPPEDEEDDEPTNGLKITLVGPSLSFDDFLDPDSLPDTLSSSIRKIFTGCSGKFSSYKPARRVLLLDPHADLQTKDSEWWKSVWSHLPPPAEIGEIWSGVLDWIDDKTQDWTFEQIYLSLER